MPAAGVSKHKAQVLRKSRHARLAAEHCLTHNHCSGACAVALRGLVIRPGLLKYSGPWPRVLFWSYKVLTGQLQGKGSLHCANATTPSVYKRQG